MNLAQILESWKNDPAVMDCVTCWRQIPAKEAVYGEWPGDLDPRIVKMLEGRGIRKPYSHQKEAMDLIRGGRDTVVVTPTASGKSLCYHIPVLDAVLRDPDARALYLFPTKALSADQVTELYGMIEDLGADIKAFTYDGDTAVSARRAVRNAGNIVVTNPDMLHSGILPNHVKWVRLFENLKYVVIDEIHTYRGVFGLPSRSRGGRWRWSTDPARPSGSATWSFTIRPSSTASSAFEKAPCFRRGCLRRY